MEKLNFKEILLSTAVCAIACDGDVDEREKEALFNIEKKSTYFNSDDLSLKLEDLITNCTNDYEVFREKLFQSIDTVELNIVEELTLLEISFRIIAADEIEEESERNFIINLRNHLKVDDEIITERFGAIEYLINKSSEYRSFDVNNNFKISEHKEEKK